MKKSILTLLLSLSVLVKIQAQNPSDAILGTWNNAEKDGKVQIYKQGAKYFGKISWAKNPRKDSENPNEKLRSRELVGVVILNNFNYTGKTWEDGSIYDPKNGKTYSCIIKQKNANTIEIRGYIGISLIGRTTVWTRDI